MSSVRQTSSGKFELCVRHKLLPERVHFTFESKSEAELYGKQLDSLLKAGIVPDGLLENKQKPSENLSVVLLAWMNSGKPARTDMDVLKMLLAEVGKLKLKDLNYSWAQGWVKNMKLVANYSPSTIRKRIGSLSRCLDEHVRQHPDLTMSNVLRLLPRGAATYNELDATQAIALNKKAKVDVSRERRLKPGEFERIMQALSGEKRPDRERPMCCRRPKTDSLKARVPIQN